METNKDNQDIPCVNPIEDQRKQALEHYAEASKAVHHWSSFVESAIKAYTPESFTPKASEPVERFCGCRSGEDCNADCVVPAWIAKRVLAARDAHIKGDYEEVYHQLYSIASPEFDKLSPEVWTDLEEMAKPEQPASEGSGETLDEALNDCLSHVYSMGRDGRKTEMQIWVDHVKECFESFRQIVPPLNVSNGANPLPYPVASEGKALPDFEKMADEWFSKHYPKTSLIDLQVKGAFIAGCYEGIGSKEYYEIKLEAFQRIIDSHLPLQEENERLKSKIEDFEMMDHHSDIKIKELEAELSTLRGQLSYYADKNQNQ